MNYNSAVASLRNKSLLWLMQRCGFNLDETTFPQFFVPCYGVVVTNGRVQRQIFEGFYCAARQFVLLHSKHGWRRQTHARTFGVNSDLKLSQATDGSPFFVCDSVSEMAYGLDNAPRIIDPQLKKLLVLAGRESYWKFCGCVDMPLWQKLVMALGGGAVGFIAAALVFKYIFKTDFSDAATDAQAAILILGALW